MKHGYIGEFEYADDHKAGKIVVELIWDLDLWIKDVFVNNTWHFDNISTIIPLEIKDVVEKHRLYLHLMGDQTNLARSEHKPATVSHKPNTHQAAQAGSLAEEVDKLLGQGTKPLLKGLVRR
ncbi:unnamed protein product [Lupinus luteus]|uniref:Uncharacterized protein n=1 Tax=Lupinus luteus TaxID=3873 RepID=A0AAV1XP37_LUPLU